MMSGSDLAWHIHRFGSIVLISRFRAVDRSACRVEEQELQPRHNGTVKGFFCFGV